MYNQEKIRRLKKAALIGGLLFIVVIFLLVGMRIGKSQQKAQQKPINQETVNKKEEKKKGLENDTVRDFLNAYFTRKDLGENRNRYKPLVTTSMYNELTNDEEQPVNQAYKGYVVNQVLDSADIYIDTENDTAICVVTYKNTQRTKIGSDEGALKNQYNQQAIQITFTEAGKKYLVDKIEAVTLTNLLNTDNNSYVETVTTDSESVLDSQSTSITEVTDTTNTTTEDSSHE